MTFEIVLAMLVIVSALTGLVTEAVKKLLDECEVHYYSNLLAGAVALVVSLAVGIGYAIIAGIDLNKTMAVYLIALVFLSWLCAMVGYDKVIQAITQATGTETEYLTTSADVPNEYLDWELTKDSLLEHTKAELKGYMDAIGITYTTRMTKEELVSAILEFYESEE